MTIKSFAVASVIGVTSFFSSALASSERSLISPFLGAGFAVGNDKLNVYDPNTLFFKESENTSRSTNMYGDIGFKLNLKSFFIAPRVGLYSANNDLIVTSFNGRQLALSSSTRLDLELLLGMHYKQAAFYMFFGGSRINYENTAVIKQELKIKQITLGFGFEYHVIKQMAFFAEFGIHYAEQDRIKIKINGVELNDNQKNLLDPVFFGEKLKFGVRFYPIG